MRTVWAVLAVMVAATVATVAVGLGVPSSAIRLPGPVTVGAATAGGGSSAVASTGAGSGVSLGGEDQPVKVVSPDRPVFVVPAPVGSDSREAEQSKAGARLPARTPSTSAGTDG